MPDFVIIIWDKVDGKFVQRELLTFATRKQTLDKCKELKDEKFVDVYILRCQGNQRKFLSDHGIKVENL